MSYVSRHLLKNESVVYTASLHWIVYWKAALFFCISVIFLIAFRRNTQSVGFYSGLLLLVPGLFFLVRVLLVTLTTELVVTSQRIVVKIGFIGRETLELKHHKVESVAVSQSILGRLLNYGDVSVHGTGGAHQLVRSIISPVRFKQEANAADEPKSEVRDAPVSVSEKQDAILVREAPAAAPLEFTRILDLGVARYMGKGARPPEWLISLVSMFTKPETSDTQPGYHVRAFDWDGRKIYTACDCVLAFSTWKMDGSFEDHSAAHDASLTTTHVRRVGSIGTLFGNGEQLFYASASGLIRLAQPGACVQSIDVSPDGCAIAAISREKSASLDVEIWSRSYAYAGEFKKEKVSLTARDFPGEAASTLCIFEGDQREANLVCVFGRSYGNRSETAKPRPIALFRVGEGTILGKAVLPGICSLTPHPMGKVVAVLGESLTLLSVPDLKVLKSTELPLVREREACFYPPIAYSACGRYLALSYSINGEVEIRNAESLEILATLDDAEGLPQPDMAWDKSGRYLACRFVKRSQVHSNHWDAHVHIWDVKTRRRAAKISASLLGNQGVGSDNGFLWAADAAEIAILVDEQRIQVYRATAR